MRVIRYLSYVLFVLIASQFAFAETGRVQGKVKDPAGKPLDKVTITIASATGNKYTTQTNSKGEYIHIGVNPGQYRVTAVKEGYVPAPQNAFVDLSVNLSEPSKADFVLQPASQQQQQPGKPDEEPAQIKQAKAAVALLNEGKLDEGIAGLKEALKIDPNLPSVHYNLGLAYERKDMHEDAQKEFQEAVKLKADFGEAYTALGDSYMASKQWAPAAEAFVKASTLMPQDYATFYNLGAAYSNLGKYTESEQAFRNAAKINPKEPVVHYQLAMALLGESKNAEAKAEFQKYLELNPNAADKAEVEEYIKSLQ